MASASQTDPVRVLVVDDSIVFRRAISHALAEIKEVSLVGTAVNGRLALAKLKQEHVDFVVLDLEMPELDGIETLKELRKSFPQVGVVMLSGATRLAADMTLRALELGALDFLSKGTRETAHENHLALVQQLTGVIRSFNTQRTLRQLRSRLAVVQDKIRNANSLPPQLALPNQGTANEVPPERSSVSLAINPDPHPSCHLSLRSLSRIDVVVIGTSTGGPQALAQVIPALPPDLGVPVLVVQHMPAVFTASLAASLAQKSHLEVVEGTAEMQLRPNQVVVAPGGWHMVVRRVKMQNGQLNNVVDLNDAPPENSCRPSADVLFRSVSTTYAGHALAVVMTGMGSDGLLGVKALKQRGSICITQDAASCTIYGMPRAVDQAGLSDESVPLLAIGGRIAGLVKQANNRSSANLEVTGAHESGSFDSANTNRT